MPNARELFREVLSRPNCTLAANIFDPLSARLAEMIGYEICVLSGSVGKSANLAAPDLVVANMSDVVDHCRRITRVCDAALLVDAEDGFGNAVNVARTVRELEAAGVAGHRNRGQFRAAAFQCIRPRPGIHGGTGRQTGGRGSRPARPGDGNRSPFRRAGAMPTGRSPWSASASTPKPAPKP